MPVVLGVVLGLVVLAGLGWFLWRKNKKKKQAGMVPGQEKGHKDEPGHYEGIGELPTHERPAEVSGEERVELE